MFITPQPRPWWLYPPLRRRRLFAVLRQAPLPLLLGVLAGLALMCGLQAPRSGGVIAGACAALFCAWPYLMMYRTVIDRTRGLPVPQPCAGPKLEMRQAAWLTEAIDGPGGLAALGFQPAGWFFLDDVDQLYVGAWLQPGGPNVAYVQYLSVARAFRFRFVRPLPGGGMLISTTRLTDIAYPPPPGIYRQMRSARRPIDLYGWHRDAERFLLGDRPAPAPAGDPRLTAERPPRAGLGEVPRPDPVALYVELLERTAWHFRLKRFWLLRFGLLRELYRQARLSEMAISEQVEEGWAPAPPWREAPGGGGADLR